MVYIHLVFVLLLLSPVCFAVPIAAVLTCRARVPPSAWPLVVSSSRSKKGYVLLLSSKTKQWAADFKLNSTATAVTFSPDSRYVLASGADADVYKFDIRSRRCVLRFFNEVSACLLFFSRTCLFFLKCLAFFPPSACTVPGRCCRGRPPAAAAVAVPLCLLVLYRLMKLFATAPRFR